MVKNASFWAICLRDSSTKLLFLKSAVLEKILPAITIEHFGDVADWVEQSECLQILTCHDPEDCDELVDWSLALGDVKQAIINLIVVLIYHFLEQQLYIIHEGETHGYSNSQKNPQGANAKHDIDIKKTAKWFLDTYGIDWKKMASWGKIDELRKVNNLIKHAGAVNAEKSKNDLPSDLFTPPALDFLQEDLEGEAPKMYDPLFGNGVYVRPNLIQKYFDAAISFCEELATLLEQSDNRQ